MTSHIVPDTQRYRDLSPITPAIWWVGRSGWNATTLTCKPDCNIYLLKGEKFDVLIDCGVGKSLTRLERNLRKAGSSSARVKEIWLTHSHLDHFIRAGYWAARYPSTVCRISRISIRYLKKRDYRLVGYPFFGAFPEDWKLPPQLLPLREGSILRCPPWQLRVEALPGHVPDQLGFRGLVDGLQVLFCGDAALGDQGESKGCIGWLDGFWLSNLKDCQHTLERLASNPPELLLPGHGQVHAGEAVHDSLYNCLHRVQRLIPDICGLVPFA